jgi:hypothetical protein
MARRAAFVLTALAIALSVTRAGASDFNPFGFYLGTDSDFACGAGVQARFQSWAFRAEYERAATSIGEPTF